MSKLEIVRIYAEQTDEKIAEVLLQIAINGLTSYQEHLEETKEATK